MRSDLIEVFIMDRDGGNLLLYVPYRRGIEIAGTTDPDLRAAWLASIIIFSDIRTGELKKVELEDFDILVNKGALTNFVMLIEKGVDEEEIRMKTVELQLDFDEKYRRNIEEFDGGRNRFYEFAFEIYKEFPLVNIDYDSTLELNAEKTDRFRTGKAATCCSLIEQYINGLRRPRDIMAIVEDEMTKREFNAALGMLLWTSGVVYIRRVQKDDLIGLVDGKDTYGKRFPQYLYDREMKYIIKNYGVEFADMVISSFDSPKSIQKAADEIRADSSVLQFVVNHLIQNGVLVRKRTQVR